MKTRLLLLGVLATASARLGQNVFVVLDAGAPKPVKKIRFHRPMIDKGGSSDGAGGAEFSLLRADGTGGRYHYTLNIYGHAKSDTAYKKCFMVLEMTAWKTNGVAFAELPDLPAGEAVELNLTFPLVDKPEEGTYRVHVFSDGVESLHSRMTAAYLEKQRKKTGALLAGKTQDWPPILARLVNPAYPAALKKSKAPGAARVRLHVTKTGDMASPELLNASDPAFGDAALNAVMKWRFDPVLKARHFVDAVIEVPVVFAPPAPETVWVAAASGFTNRAATPGCRATGSARRAIAARSSPRTGRRGAAPTFTSRATGAEPRPPRNFREPPLSA